MKTAINIFFILVISLGVKAQSSFKTIVPQRPVVAGESFQVQYIIEDDGEISLMKKPVFANFRIVTGPNNYYGSVATINGIKLVRNTVYTLVATRPGRFLIPGAVAIINGEAIRSNDVMIEVLTKDEAVKRFNREAGTRNSGYILRPGEDAYEKIRQNLFLKVMVDKKSCYVGEPVLATFKLYSRLESKSDIVRNPGFYGFTVYDMVNLSDKQTGTEYVNRNTFDVHTIRKVQLYPLQSGDYTIDAMEVKNKVEFSRSIVNKKTEQEIMEGVLGQEEEEEQGEGTELFETSMRTEPVKIHVKKTPEKARPPGYNGAVGRYTISTALRKNELSRNEEGVLEIIIRGKGNFIQVDAPAIQWPEGIEGLEPAVKDALSKSGIPLTGQRSFRYPFVASVAGEYIIPSLSFSFFNPDSGTYKTLFTDSLKLKINNIEKEQVQVSSNDLQPVPPLQKNRLFLAGILLAMMGGLTWYFLSRKKRKLISETAEIKNGPSLDEILAPAYEVLKEEDKFFYSSLHSSVWNFFRARFAFSGSEMNKSNLVSRLKAHAVNSELVAEVLDILSICESGMFTNADLSIGKERFLKRSRQALEKISLSLF